MKQGLWFFFWKSRLPCGVLRSCFAKHCILSNAKAKCRMAYTVESSNELPKVRNVITFALPISLKIRLSSSLLLYRSASSFASNYVRYAFDIQCPIAHPTLLVECHSTRYYFSVATTFSFFSLSPHIRSASWTTPCPRPPPATPPTRRPWRWPGRSSPTGQWGSGWRRWLVARDLCEFPTKSELIIAQRKSKKGRFFAIFFADDIAPSIRMK